MRIVERGLEDIVALGGNSVEDEREFEAVARLSEVSKGFYATFVQPWIKPWITSQVVAAMSRMQPLRLGYALCSDKNPLMRGVAPLAEKARAERKPVDADNPFLKIQEQVSDGMTASLQALGSLYGKTAEAIFHAVYGSPWVQGWLGVNAQNGRPRPKPGTSPDQEAALAAKAEELRATMAEGGPLEARVRAGLYIVGGQHAIDARTFEVLRRTLKAHPEIALDHFKAVVREQWARLVLDEKAAMQALPRLLPVDADARRAMFDEIRVICTASGELEEEARRRLDEIKAVLESEASACAPALIHGERERQGELHLQRTKG